MTLVLAVHGRETIWLLTDRRLSYGARRPPVDDAMKVVELHTIDGVGLLAYAGLGATARGTQTSEWINGVLRGRGGLKFEQALSFVAAAANSELPRHLAAMPFALNNIVVPARIYGLGPRMYSIDNKLDAAGAHSYRFASHQRSSDPASSVRAALGGSGAYFLRTHGSANLRELLSLVKANDRGRVSDHAVADRFAELNWQTHRATLDGTVGPRCVVIWRRWPESRLNAVGGAHQFYDGLDRESDSMGIPAISNGMDVRSIVSVTMQVALPEMHRALLAQENPNIDNVLMDQLLAAMPSDPDDKLR